MFEDIRNNKIKSWFKKEKRDEYFRDKDKNKREQKKIFTNEDIIKFYDSYKNNSIFQPFYCNFHK